MGYTPAPPGSRLFLDFTRDQFCGKSLDRSGMCGEPAVISGSTAWIPDGLRFSGGYAKVENNDNIDILSASPQKPVIWWLDAQLLEPRMVGWILRKAFSPNSIDNQIGMYLAGDSYLQVRLNSGMKIFDVISTVFTRKERFIIAIFWDGVKCQGWINGEKKAEEAYSGTVLNGDYLCIGSRDPGSTSHFDGNIFQCGITVGAQIYELHEWHRKYKTGNLQNTSVVAMQSGTLPDSTLDSTIMLKK